ncbi:MAG: hypothetical protein AB1938_29920 [Myxococcota bacterium]
MSTTMRYPLFCGFREVVVGRKFAAGVELNGRALAEKEQGGWWLYGVNPGAIAGSGMDLSAAVADFRLRLKGVLFDFAADADDFECFRKEVLAFFKSSDAETEAEWQAARDLVRAGKVDLKGMRKEKAERPRSARVVLLKLAPQENVLDKGASLAA